MNISHIKTFFVFMIVVAGSNSCYAMLDRNLSGLLEEKLGAHAAPVSSNIITLDGYILPRSGIEVVEQALTSVLTGQSRASGLYAMLAKNTGKGDENADKGVADALFSVIDVSKAGRAFGAVPENVRHAMTWTVVYAASQCGLGAQRSQVSNIEKRIEAMAKKSGSNIKILDARIGLR